MGESLGANNAVVTMFHVNAHTGVISAEEGG